MTRKSVVVYMGVIGSGKGYHSQKRVDEGYTKMSFASTLREVLFATLGFPTSQQELLDYDQFKKDVWTANGLTGRRLLQNLGTEGIRRVDPEFFTRALVKKIKEHPGKNFVIDDCRFANEVQCVRDNFESSFYLTNYKSSRYDATSTHPSEALTQQLLKEVRFNVNQDLTWFDWRQYEHLLE